MVLPASRPWIVSAVLFALAAASESRAQGVTSPYLSHVWRYRAGDHEGAVAGLAALPLRGLRARVKDDLESEVCRQAGRLESCRELPFADPITRGRVSAIWRAALPAAVLLHVETTELCFREGRLDAVDVHRQIVRDLLERMSDLAAGADTGLAELESARERGFLLHVWTMQQQLDSAAVERELVRAIRERPDDPWLLLASGWVEEFRAWPASLRELYRGRPGQGIVPGGRTAWLRRERAFRLSRAEDRYRAALRHAGDEAEIHLRLGRVLMLQGRGDEARRALDRVRRTSGESSLRYLAALFVARIHERSDARAARSAYVEALEVWPGAQSARLGLSRLDTLDGQHHAARARLWWESGDGGGDTPSDPWFWYEYGQAWRIPSALAAEREAFRR